MNEDLVTIYANSFKENWTLPALTDYGDQASTITYGDMARRIARLHLFFESQGVKAGDKIALCGRNTTTWVTVFMATITYGAVIVPVLQDFNAQDAQHIINHSESVMLFASNSVFENLDFEALPGLRCALSIDNRRVLAERGDEKNLPSKVLKNLTRKFKTRYRNGYTRDDVNYTVRDKHEMAVLNYTSGTTGFSKGVMLTFDNLAGNVVFGDKSRLHYQGSRALSFLPLAHAYGCAFDMLVTLAVGSHVTLFGRLPSPRLLLKAFSEVRPNLIVTVPLILEKIYKTHIVPMITKQTMRWALAIPLLDKAIYSKIRSKLVEAFGGAFEEVIVGGAPLNKEVEEFLHRIKFPFTVGYGMTECGPLISYTPWRSFELESCGRTLPGIMHSKIVSDDQENIPGEICVKGQNVMAGYYKNPDATNAVIDEDGWLHTGDMGVRKPDGTLFIKGRYKTMILSATGQNIYPEEIESKLNNMPYVNESLVVERGKGLEAIVYPDYEQMDRDKLTIDRMGPIMEDVRKELNKIVAPYERIEHIQLIPNEFEKTPKRSIKRYLYR
ncbi:MAG: long-chain fatty acid--CoA ligase [Bacteroidales bacterium]|nr:long-chain fatty acid--CoA ligase [Bacteroidales bacterium]MBD5247792.1 long-chain fatty acid--CoA ligase [Barnesiella sp.]MBD5257359.1 long-chain fatty acid--CoA ligase [Barnesiella sp.]